MPLPIRIPQIRNPHTAGTAVNELPVANEKADMSGLTPGDRRKAENVPGKKSLDLQLDGNSLPELILAYPGKTDPIATIGIPNKAGTVESVRIVPTPLVGSPDSLESSLHHAQGDIPPPGLRFGRRLRGSRLW